jgi:hypothetical protein
VQFPVSSAVPDVVAFTVYLVIHAELGEISFAYSRDCVHKHHLLSTKTKEHHIL